jgi:hypothetical protein
MKVHFAALSLFACTTTSDDPIAIARPSPGNDIPTKGQRCPADPLQLPRVSTWVDEGEAYRPSVADPKAVDATVHVAVQWSENTARPFLPLRVRLAYLDAADPARADDGRGYTAFETVVVPYGVEDVEVRIHPLPGSDDKRILVGLRDDKCYEPISDPRLVMIFAEKTPRIGFRTETVVLPILVKEGTTERTILARDRKRFPLDVCLSFGGTATVGADFIPAQRQDVVCPEPYVISFDKHQGGVEFALSPRADGEDEEIETVDVAFVPDEQNYKPWDEPTYASHREFWIYEQNQDPPPVGDPMPTGTCDAECGVGYDPSGAQCCSDGRTYTSDPCCACLVAPDQPCEQGPTSPGGGSGSSSP